MIDWDPTEGLPVRKWERTTVKVNQDASIDPSDANNQNTNNNDSDFPWPEQSLPSFFNQLPPHNQVSIAAIFTLYVQFYTNLVNQELIRRARMGNIHAKPSVWDSKSEEWIPAKEVEARKTARLKSKSLMTTNNPDSPNSQDENDNEDADDDLFDADGLPEKRRKTNSGNHERVFETKKWVQIPALVAEKMPEPKYLADRRPGMESLYGGAYKATNGFGSLGINPAIGAGATNYDLGDGSGLGNAAGVLGGGTANEGPATPVRKNIPPKRKKKKLGGPGRKKANPVPVENAGGAVAGGEGDQDVAMTDTIGGEEKASVPTAENATGEGEVEGDGEGEGEGSGSDSEGEGEGEGSEEGEIEEDGKAAVVSPPEVETAPAPAPPATEAASALAAAESVPVATPPKEEVVESAVVAEVSEVVGGAEGGEVVEDVVDGESGGSGGGEAAPDPDPVPDPAPAAEEIDLLGGLEAAVEKQHEAE